MDISRATVRPLLASRHQSFFLPDVAFAHKADSDCNQLLRFDFSVSSYVMFSIFRVLCFALLTLSLSGIVDARFVKRAPVGANGERLARRLPLPRPKRLYDPYKREYRYHENTVTLLSMRLVFLGVPRDGPSNIPTITTTVTVRYDSKGSK